MADLIILTGETPDLPWEWGMTSSGEWGRAITPEEKAGLKGFAFTRLIVVLPGTHIISKVHSLESLNEKQKRQAIGFSLEDEIATSLDDTHIAIDPRSDKINLIDKDYLSAVFVALDEAELDADIICADYECIGGDQLHVFGGRMINASLSGAGYAADISLAEQFLETGQTLPAETGPETMLSHIATAFEGGVTPLNLRQGMFARKRSIGAARTKRLAGLAAGLLLAVLAVNVGAGLKHKSDIKAANAEIESIYTELFPGKPLPRNPAVAILKAQRSGGSVDDQQFSKLSAVLASGIKQVDGAELSSVRYNQSRNQLDISVIYDSFGDAEKLKQAIVGLGGQLTEGGTRQVGEELSGDAVVKLGS